MTTDQAEELQRKWSGKLCNHPDIIEESKAEPSPAVTWRCLRCGRPVDFDEWRNSRVKARKNPQQGTKRPDVEAKLSGE